MKTFLIEDIVPRQKKAPVIKARKKIITKIRRAYPFAKNGNLISSKDVPELLDRLRLRG
jgi:hypothetical protein